MKPDPVLRWLIVSETARRTFTLPQNFVLGHLVHKSPLIASFWFCVKPCKHRCNSSLFDKFINNDVSTSVKTDAKRFWPLYFFQLLEYVHHEPLGHRLCCWSNDCELSRIMCLKITQMSFSIDSLFPTLLLSAKSFAFYLLFYQ